MNLEEVLIFPQIQGRKGWLGDKSYSEGQGGMQQIDIKDNHLYEIPVSASLGLFHLEIRTWTGKR